jgi:hypothetical protein
MTADRMRRLVASVGSITTKYLTLQRYLMKYLVQAPFPVREIGTVLTLLHACHVP